MFAPRVLERRPDRYSLFIPDDDIQGYREAYVQDCEPILERNAALRQDEKTTFADGELIASIPNNILFKWMVEDGIEWWTDEGLQRVLKKLRDPCWRYLRTSFRSI